MIPWNHWYHLSAHTYGTWLPGDPRGFRTRHHREHVNGDYKNPPSPGKYDLRYRQAKSQMKRDPVHLDATQRTRAASEIMRSFRKWNIECPVAGVDAIHLHVLIRTPDQNPRHWLGLAKKECSAYMRRDGLAPDGGLWAVRCGVKPISDETHYENVKKYIADHVLEGAAVEFESDGFEGIDLLLS